MKSGQFVVYNLQYEFKLIQNTEIIIVGIYILQFQVTYGARHDMYIMTFNILNRIALLTQLKHFCFVAIHDCCASHIIRFWEIGKILNSLSNMCL